jgi:hypothetical protein
MDGSRRDAKSKLDEKFISYASLSPGGIVPRHGQDKPEKIFGNPWSAYSPGFQTPEQSEAFSMPPDEGLRPDRD